MDCRVKCDPVKYSANVWPESRLIRRILGLNLEDFEHLRTSMQLVTARRVRDANRGVPGRTRGVGA
ncbi:hypothetical protein Q9L58_010152 [Maublancomyces gigas]|uniref:Uncharacterized protein n=1 Tax=Discina gigas TaxID=1032678 RepID=A0ABR3G4Y2_9PEZI